MTKEEFLKMELCQISQVYSGKDKWCRCGCGGYYIETSFKVNPHGDVNDELAESLLKRAKTAVRRGNKFEAIDCWINISFSNNQAICFYTDDLPTH